MMEEPVAAAIVLIDPRRTDSTAHLAMLHAANNRESLERLLHAVQEQVGHEGIRRVVLPVGLSPYLGTGVLQDQFHREPPFARALCPTLCAGAVFDGLPAIGTQSAIHDGSGRPQR